MPLGLRRTYVRNVTDAELDARPDTSGSRRHRKSSRATSVTVDGKPRRGALWSPVPGPPRRRWFDPVMWTVSAQASEKKKKKKNLRRRAVFKL